MEALGGERYDPNEMNLFGFDPSVPEDREIWDETTPKRDEPVTDYSRDSFEIGSQPGMQAAAELKPSKVD